MSATTPPFAQKMELARTLLVVSNVDVIQASTGMALIVKVEYAGKCAR